MRRARRRTGMNSPPRGAEDRHQPGADGTAGHQPTTDEVDELVKEWHAQRPDLDVAPLQVLSRIWRLARHLDRERAAAYAGHPDRTAATRTRVPASLASHTVRRPSDVTPLTRTYVACDA